MVEGKRKGRGRRISERLAFFSLPLLLAAGTLTSCADRNKIVIGFAGSLSGKDYQLGVEGRNAALLYVRKTNEEGGLNGRKLRLSIKDFRSDDSAIVPADKALLDEGAAVIFGHFTSSSVDKALDFANAHKIPLVSPTATSESLSGKDDFFLPDDHELQAGSCYIG